MVNQEEFTKRLQIVIDYYDETASGFAEKIGVQRSSISHILSGRNKPSLEFVMKVLHACPEVELYWLLNGKGNFPNTIYISKNTEPNITPTPKAPQPITSANSDIEKIVIFYKDGTFKSYLP
ncbi:helix-turn-helix domain-containing protein [uncultured Winogradskyella sp.]|uniref:helix-turn-helix domain-containing protein n=1 Tax=uncultured Winogradskyella sp. TaxID=395353 RepID=UPI00260469FB|nr:helix-turn-helix domain-containing protein [uncultured Winogradskyella sp.]